MNPVIIRFWQLLWFSKEAMSRIFVIAFDIDVGIKVSILDLNVLKSHILLLSKVSINAA